MRHYTGGLEATRSDTWLTWDECECFFLWNESREEWGKIRCVIRFITWAGLIVVVKVCVNLAYRSGPRSRSMRVRSLPYTSYCHYYMVMVVPACWMAIVYPVKVWRKVLLYRYPNTCITVYVCRAAESYRWGLKAHNFSGPLAIIVYYFPGL